MAQMRRRKASTPRFIWKSPRELTVADPGEGAPPLIFRPNAEKKIFGDRPGPPLCQGLHDRVPLI